MKAVYVRVSTEEQSKKGYSLQNQIQECKEKAGTNEVIEYVDDGYSGEFLERPGLSKLRKDVQAGQIEAVYCYDPDRLSRKLMNALIIDDEFRSKGVEIIYINGEYADSPEGKMFYSFRGAISEFEKAKINERMTSGRTRKAKEGKVVKNSNIYGYDYDKPNARYVTNEFEARIVRLIFDKFTNDQIGMNSIAKYLTAQGIKTKMNKDTWHRQVVRQILMNEAYTGTYYQNKWNTEGMLKNKYTNNPDEKISMKMRDKSEWIAVDIPQIISDEQFNQAAELLKEARRRWAKSSVNQYLLSGLLRCQGCGNTMTGVKARWWGKTRFIYTDRKNHAGAKHPGCVLEIPTEKLDNFVWGQIQTLLDEPEKINEYNNNVDVSDELEQAEHLEKEIEKTKKGREKLYSLFAMEDLNVDEIKKQIVDFQEKENNLQQELDKLNDKIESAKKKTDIEQIRKIMNQFVKKGEFTFEEKRNYIRLLVKQIIVKDKENIRIELF